VGKKISKQWLERHKALSDIGSMKITQDLLIITVQNSKALNKMAQPGATFKEDTPS
jgi:hypothetical protein